MIWDAFRRLLFLVGVGPREKIRVPHVGAHSVAAHAAAAVLGRALVVARTRRSGEAAHIGARPLKGSESVALAVSLFVCLFVLLLLVVLLFIVVVDIFSGGSASQHGNKNSESKGNG